MVTLDKMMLCAPSLAAIDGVAHGFFTRLDGVSEGIYASLNCGPGSRDDAANVTENRARVAGILGATPENLLSVYQAHSPVAVIAEKPWAKGKIPEADAIVSATPGLAIGVLTADCAPVLFCDGEARVVGAAHAGWRGALSGVIEATVKAMMELGASPERIRAVIGPAISQGAYEVGEDFRQKFLSDEPDSAAFFATDEGSGEPHFDLPGYVADRLARAGVVEIVDLGLCTYYDETRLFSYRRSQHHGEGDYGRQISAILLA
ncbi:MAG: peptidoglycan editing factor PgeF [Methyloceanibacter sp.]|uniref:peptidoglycan editing factor PgeF n=1 Tax=Methyloceanibacter sp. TaxID=1965321 RepID=UPI003D6CE8B4